MARMCRFVGICADTKGTLVPSSQFLKPVDQAAGIERIHWHTIRHRNNSIMLAEGWTCKHA
jgi:hypothetical protein